ncbi:Mce protein [Mycobacterium sp.]|uniref:Mce protein n=1 Tax=Mycobacterium sp. TaxID=1785 RepID=UPI003A861DC0
MEGDAGASQLNPIDAGEADGDPKVTGEAFEESEPGTDLTNTEVTDADSGETRSGTGAAECKPTGEVAEGSSAASAVPDSADAAEAAREAAGDTGNLSRVNRRWLTSISVVLMLLAGVLGATGYYTLRLQGEARGLAGSNSAALKAAQECIGATQAPDTASMATSQQKIIDCGTDQFRTQALLYSGMLVQAYQAANVHLQVSDMRSAVERDNPDGSVDVLVALRVKVSNEEAQGQEAGYRLRVRMTPVDGTYKISRLDQVTK